MRVLPNHGCDVCIAPHSICPHIERCAYCIGPQCEILVPTIFAESYVRWGTVAQNNRALSFIVHDVMGLNKIFQFFVYHLNAPKSPKHARLLFEFVIIVGDDLVVQQEVVVVFVHFRQNVRERLVHYIDDLLALEQFAVFLN